MPILTLCSKSMPSTCSRKPCTKCWRDCSPSPITSRPASSCALIHSRVASALACASSAPSDFHCGQSLWVSASHAGLGRLPAMVELKRGRVVMLESPKNQGPDEAGAERSEQAAGTHLGQNARPSRTEHAPPHDRSVRLHHHEEMACPASGPAPALFAAHA